MSRGNRRRRRCGPGGVGAPGASRVPPRPPSPTLGCARAGGTPIAPGGMNARGWRHVRPPPAARLRLATLAAAARPGAAGGSLRHRCRCSRPRRGGDGVGVGARSGWRVHAPYLSSMHSRARPRTTAPTAAPHHPPPVGATATPTAQNPAPQASNPSPHRAGPCAAGVSPQPPPGRTLRRRHTTSMAPTAQTTTAGTTQPNTRPSVYTTGPAAASGRATPAVKWTKRDG